MYGLDWLTLVFVPLIVGLISYFLNKILDIIGRATKNNFNRRRLAKEIVLTMSVFVQIAEGTYEAITLKSLQGAMLGLSCCMTSFIVGVLLEYASIAENSLILIMKISFMIMGSILCWQTALFFRLLDSCARIYLDPCKAVGKLEIQIKNAESTDLALDIETMKLAARNIASERKGKLYRLLSNDSANNTV